MTVSAAFAPGTVANLCVGFDVLGLAVDGPGDLVSVDVTRARAPDGSLRDDAAIVVEVGEIIGADGAAALPTDPARNTACIAARETLRAAGHAGRIRIHLEKGLPVGSGLGSSAASAVAAAYATNLAVGSPLRKIELIDPCLRAEEAVSGRHADNIAPALLGGLVLIRGLDPTDIVRLPIPRDLHLAIVSPRLIVRTREARALIPREVPLASFSRQAAELASFISACYAGDLDLLGRCLNDEIVEPVRAGLITGGPEALAAMRASGVIGASISGSGPALFALCRSASSAEAAGDAAVAAFADAGVQASWWRSAADCPGVREA